MSYYKKQLDKLTNSEYYKTVVFTDGDGNKTNYMNLNKESIPVFIEYLENEYNRLVELDNVEHAKEVK